MKKEQIVTQWYIEYHKIMRKRAYDITNDYHLAKDMVQEAFVKIIKKYNKLVTLGEPERMVYILFIVRSVCVDYLRKHKIETRYMLELREDDELLMAEVTEETIDIYARQDFWIDIKDKLSQLNERDAMLILAKYFWEMSSKEIAKLIGIKEQNVYSYVTRAVNRLAKLMEEEV